MGFCNSFARNIIVLVLIMANLIVMIILRIKFKCLVKEQLIILMTTLVLQRKRLVLVLLKQRQNFAWVCITMVIIFLSFLTRKKFITLKFIIRISTFQFNFCKKTYLKNLMLLNLEKYLIKEICMISQSNTTLLINMTSNIHKYLIVKNNIK